MARGDVINVNAKIDIGTEILNRTPFEGVAMTLDFTNVAVDPDLGVKVVKAGMFIDGNGVPLSDVTGAAGILLHDVFEEMPQGTILKKAYINKARVEANSGLTYDADAIKAVLPMIVVE